MNFVRLREQHNLVLKIASDLMRFIPERATPDRATSMRALIEELNWVLELHLALEDQVLYPAMIASQDAAMRELAQDCVEDVGGLGEVWAGYYLHWTVDRIMGEPNRFAATTSSLLSALACRLDREEREVYPAAEGSLVREQTAQEACSPSF